MRDIRDNKLFASRVARSTMQVEQGCTRTSRLTQSNMAFKCPNCSATLADKSWLDVLFEDENGREPEREILSFSEDWHLSKVGEIPIQRTIRGSWIKCLECNHVLVRFSQTRRQPVRGQPPREGTDLGTETWLVIPRRSTRPVPKEVDEAIPEQAEYYRQASAILDESPIASAVLSRRVLADLLKKYAGRDEYNLEKQVDKFIEDTSAPPNLRENLHHFREVANFAAHTQEDDQANIVDVDRDEAEWTLDMLDRLFDYFIVTPARDAAIRAKMDKKIGKAGRKPIRTLEQSAPDEEP